MKKSLFVALLLIVILALAACAPAAPAEEPAAEEPAAEEPAAEEPTEAPAEEPAGPPAECADNPDETVCAVFEPGDTIKIGFAGPTSGDVANFGIDTSQGGLLAVADGGDIEGFTFELLVEDDQGSGEGGTAVANLYCADPDVVAIHGHMFSGATAAAIPIYNDCRKPLLSPSATRSDLTTGDQDVFNRIPFTDDQQGAEAAVLMAELGYTKIAVMHDGQAYGQGLADRVAAVFAENGGEVVAAEVITPGEADYTAAITAVLAAGPEAIYYGGYDAEAAVIVNNLAAAGAEVQFMSGDGTFGSNFLDLAGANAEGAIVSAGLPPASAAVDEFGARYEAEYGTAAGVLSGYTWHGYDVAAVLIQAIKSVAILGEDGYLYIPRDALVAAVRATADYQGLTGLITCQANGECNAGGPTFFRVVDGAWEQVER